MHITHTRRAAAGAWILAVFAGGTFLQTNSVIGWGMVALFAAAPAYMLFRWERGPAETMSESIQKSIR